MCFQEERFVTAGFRIKATVQRIIIEVRGIYLIQFEKIWNALMNGRNIADVLLSVLLEAMIQWWGGWGESEITHKKWNPNN